MAGGPFPPFVPRSGPNASKWDRPERDPRKWIRWGSRCSRRVRLPLGGPPTATGAGCPQEQTSGSRPRRVVRRSCLRPNSAVRLTLTAPPAGRSHCRRAIVPTAASRRCLCHDSSSRALLDCRTSDRVKQASARRRMGPQRRSPRCAVIWLGATRRSGRGLRPDQSSVEALALTLGAGATGS
jgi:hypothetical protein